MIKHIVFFRLKEEAEGHTKMENALTVKHGLETLKDKIACLKSCEIGLNIPNAPNTNFDICLQCEFATWDDLNFYANHPEHLKVVEFIMKVKEARSAVDYEI